jgi:hypothetical protein
MTDLILYEAARTALAAAKSVDEVKKVLVDAAAIAAYSKIAKDRTLEADAVEIRKRAERRLGEMMAAQPKATGSRLVGKVAGTVKGKGKAKARVTGGLENNPPEKRPITLAEAGIDKNLANRARAAADLSESDFESEIREIRNDVETRSECSRPRKIKFTITHEKTKLVVPHRVSYPKKDDDATDPTVVVKPKKRPAVVPADDPTALRSTLMHRATEAIDAAASEDWSEVTVDVELVEAVARVAEAWNELAVSLGRMLADPTPGNKLN